MESLPPLPPPPPGRQPEAEEPVEPAGPAPSPLRAVLVVGAITVALAGVAAAGYWWLHAPGVCETSTVDSARFGYCVAAPGWEFTNRTAQSPLPFDELIKPSDSSTVRILAIRLESGQDLDFVAEQVRELAIEQGYELRDVVRREVAGVPAMQWDGLLTDGEVSQLRREVVFVHEGSAWLVQLQADTDGFPARAQEFEDILRTWTFR